MQMIFICISLYLTDVEVFSVQTNMFFTSTKPQSSDWSPVSFTVGKESEQWKTAYNIFLWIMSKTYTANKKRVNLLLNLLYFCILS